MSNPQADVSTAWMPLGPSQVTTAAYGAVTGRVTSIAVDPVDATGNTVYLGTTGGGVWKSTNAAGTSTDATFSPLTDNIPSTAAGIASISIGAVTVQPGGTGVVMAGTGDPNDALDSYYGSGILRSTDGGTTWSAITQSSDNLYGPGEAHSFYGEGFAGFAWSTVNPSLVIAAVTQALDASIVSALQPNSVEGLYYSTDAGVTWQMGTIEDGNGQIIQSPATSFSGYDGNAATAVVWNPIRQVFVAAIRYHGYYQSANGITWTRLANQPGTNLTTSNCPTRPSSPGAVSCPLFRGALAVQPVTGDTFAFTVDQNGLDQGIWRDLCTANSGSCTTGNIITFASQIADTALQNGSGGIAQGDYNLWLAAVPANADTLLYAGTEDILKCSLAENCVWRNTTNVNTCAAAKVGPSQHAVGVAPATTLIYFGNDSGLWRTTDGINQTQPQCSNDDASHFANLNGGLGSLAEVTSLAQSGDATIMAGLGVNGTAATIAAAASGQIGWSQALDGFGSYGAIDPVNPQNWYTSSGGGVSISFCGSGGACDPAAYAATPIVGDAQTASDGEGLLNPAVWMLDPQNASALIVGTCRIWRGSVANGVANWSPSNALSGMLDGDNQQQCQGNAQILSLAASGTMSGVNQGTDEEALFAGMEGTANGGGTVAGHVFTTTVSPSQSGIAPWTDLFTSPVVNDTWNQNQFNPGGFGISSIVVDTHDTTGQTIYATVQGFSSASVSTPGVYRSTNGGQSWTAISANLPIAPVNALLVDPGNPQVVYLATDAGVYVTTSVSNCSAGAAQCWSAYQTGLPPAPATALSATDDGQLLRAATYGRGVWETQLVSASTPGSSGTTTATLSPSALSFGTQQMGSASPAQTITVTNTGAQPLTITVIHVTGDFSEQDDCAGSSVPAGEACTVSVEFDPTSEGTRTGTLSVLGNIGTTGQVTAQLTGVGAAAGQMVLQPTQLTFPPTLVSTTSGVQYVTLSNTGGTPVTLQAPVVSGDYQISNTSCTGGMSLAPQEGCTVGIVFTPKRGGQDNGTFSIGTSAGTLTAALNGAGQAPATDSLNTTALTFGAQTVGTLSAAQSVTLTNAGDQALTTISANSSAGDFVVNATACQTNLPGHQSCTLTVAFSPQAVGLRSGTLTISDSLHSGSSALEIPMSGTGVAPSATVSLLPSTLSFGAQGVGTTSNPQTLTLTNNSNVTLQGMAASVTGDFQVTSNSCGQTLAAAASCPVAIAFTPSATGNRSGTVTVTSTNGQSVSASLAGMGLSFTMQVVGSSTATVVSGNPANYIIGLTPAGASSGTVQLTCSGAPSGSTCTVLPATVQMTAGTTANATVTVTSPGLTTTSHLTIREWERAGLTLACFLPVGFVFRRRMPSVLLAALFAILLSGSMLGCGVSATGQATGGTGGTSGGSGGTTSASNTITVTASAPGTQQSVTVTYILEQ